MPDPQDLDLSLSLNGERRQHSTTREMISTVAETIAFASRFMTLEPGDVIETGTPSGVGATTGTYVKAGDVMEARIEKLGRSCARPCRVTPAALRPASSATARSSTARRAPRRSRRSRHLGGRIAAIGDLAQADAAQRIDAHGSVVCPGFIDAHSHSDLTLLSDGRGLSKVHQGVTTEIVGNCGLGVAPLASPRPCRHPRRHLHRRPRPVRPWTWPSMADYLQRC